MSTAERCLAKQVTAWLDLRNDGDTGTTESYYAPRVALMRDGVQNFIVRVAG